MYNTIHNINLNIQELGATRPRMVLNPTDVFNLTKTT